MEFVWLILILIVMFFIGTVVSVNDENNKQQPEQARRQEQERQQKEFQEMRQTIISFAEKNGVYLKELYQKRDMYYNQAISDLFISTMAKPITPTYTKGVVSGSLGDNIATIANAQKKADYEKAMEENERTAQSAEIKLGGYIDYAERIISELKQIPDSQQYVEYEERKYKETMEQIYRIKIETLY